MPNIGPMEIAIVVIIALVVFGPSKLPELGNSLGKGMREFKASISGEDNAEEAETARLEANSGASKPAAVRAEAQPVDA